MIKLWYRKSLTPITCLLLPFAWLFGMMIAIRRWLYLVGILKTKSLPVPVVVVGNLTVGGTGKTPLVIWLAWCLQAAGFKPGIISRGCGGKPHAKPRLVSYEDKALEVGDETLLLLHKTDCPVAICVDRVAAAQTLLAQTNCNIIISDDGLQHYSLGRTLEIVVVDGAREFGNQQLLPAGPLREPLARLKTVDFIVVNGGCYANAYNMELQPVEFVSLQTPSQCNQFGEFAANAFHAVAGIGNPARFFSMLQQAGFNISPHVFPDHYAYQAKDFNFSDRLPIVMTEKDAVKCLDFADERYWYVRVNTRIDDELMRQILNKL